MSRRSSLRLWAGALGLALARWVWQMVGESRSGYVVLGPGGCLRSGGWIDLPLYVKTFVPLYWYGMLPAVLVGFLLWWKAGRAGRVLVRVIAVPVVLASGWRLGVFALDALIEPDCLPFWGGPYAWPNQGHRVVEVVVASLMLLAVRLRSRRLPRPVVAAGVLLVVVLVTEADAASGRVTVPDADACPGAPAAGFSAAEWRFLCDARVSDWHHAGVETMPDARLLAYGRGLCELATRHGGDATAKAVKGAAKGEEGRKILGATRQICPVMVRGDEANIEKHRLEQENWLAGRRAACASLPQHKPRARPVRQAKEYFSTEWGIDTYEDEPSGELAADLLKTGMVIAATPGNVAISPVTEMSVICVTGESYRQRPPVEKKGWDVVVEIGYTSTLGDLRFTDTNRELPDLTVGGPGNYRIRLHMRALPEEEYYDETKDPAPSEQWLIMVYPGDSKKTVRY
ncbi:hypothetical protein [Nonomuraea sp. NPDC046570]|uniref:hypothetical protein n=1 Tax=Nonomuraea sp. NPDC046570 TaxID=3155255 RepID=UPI0033CAFE00